MKTKTLNHVAGRFSYGRGHDGPFPKTFPMKTINLVDEIKTENRKVLVAEDNTLTQQTKLDAEVNRVLVEADQLYQGMLMTDLGFDYKLAEAQKIQKIRQDLAHLPQERIMDQAAIQATCIEYGLRFLPTRFYRGALDAQIGAKLEEFRKLCGGVLPVSGEKEMVGDNQGAVGSESKVQFYIAAPAESFVLRPAPKDPILFCRLTAGKFFLLHKWGSDFDASEKKARTGKTGSWNWNSDQEGGADLFERIWANPRAFSAFR